MLLNASPFVVMKVDPVFDLDGPQLDFAGRHPHMIRISIDSTNAWGPAGFFWTLPQQLWPYIQGDVVRETPHFAMSPEVLSDCVGFSLLTANRGVFSTRTTWMRSLTRRCRRQGRQPPACGRPTRSCLSLTFHCLSLTFHFFSLTFHCLSLTFPRPCTELSLSFP